MKGLYPIGTEFDYVYEPDLGITDYFKSTQYSVFRYRVVEHVQVMRFWGDTVGGKGMKLEVVGHYFADPDMEPGLIKESITLPKGDADEEDDRVDRVEVYTGAKGGSVEGGREAKGHADQFDTDGVE